MRKRTGREGRNGLHEGSLYRRVSVRGAEEGGGVELLVLGNSGKMQNEARVMWGRKKCEILPYAKELG